MDNLKEEVPNVPTPVPVVPAYVPNDLTFTMICNGRYDTGRSYRYDTGRSYSGVFMLPLQYQSRSDDHA